MSIFICNCCQYIFDSDTIPDSCPSCSMDSIMLESNVHKKFSVPSVRLANETELKLYLIAHQNKGEMKDYLSRLKSLENYSLDVNEHNMAIVLLHTYKDITEIHMVRFYLDNLLHPRKDYVNNRMAVTNSHQVLNPAVDSFKAAIAKERRDVGENDIKIVASKTSPDSAANALMRFKWDDEAKEIIGASPNLSNIRRINTNMISDNPSTEFLKFLRDWNNSL